jgi:uncharacterized protein DUF6152
MMKRILTSVVVVSGWLMASGTMQAHHSLAGVYDMKGEKEITGTLTKIQFVNPHGSMTIEVKNTDGTMTEWKFTTGSATTLAERGIGKGTLKGGRDDHREVHPGAQWQSARIPEDGDHGRGKSIHGVGRQPQRLAI